MNSKLIVGYWKYEKMERFSKISNGKKTAADTLSDEQSLMELKKSYRDQDKKQIAAMNETMYTALSFKEDKTATVIFRKNNFHGVWKMNRKGNKIVVTDTTSKTYVVQITAVDSLYLKTLNPVLDGNLQRIFRKQP
ncbi:MAG: hypothetical protein NTW16_05275 [Bacteroidetes bacterium]|nr:hypothetical protein [Bacteroidota bacterium]